MRLRAARAERPTDAPDRRTEIWYRSAAGALTALLLGCCIAWALSTPAFHGPDEALHVNSVNRLMSGDGWPRPYDAPVMGTTWQALAEAGSPLVAQHFPDGPDVAPAPPGQRSSLDSPTQFDDRWRDQMVQHPPGYYAAEAAVVKAAGGTSLRWDHAVLLMRIFSAVCLAAGLPFLIGIGRRLTGSRTAGLVGGSAVLAVPYFATMGGYVTNDAMVFTFVSALLYGAVRALDSPHVVRWLLFSGVMLGLGLLVKGFLLLAIPVLLVFSVIAVWRIARPWWWRVGIVLMPQAVAFVIGGWWWLRNLVVIGALQPSQYGDRVPKPGVQTHPGAFTRAFVERFFQLFWGRGADRSIAYPDVLVTIATVLLVVVVVAALVASRRRVVLLLLLGFGVLVTLTIFRNAYGIYADIGVSNRGVQGRYVFGGFAGISACVATLVAWTQSRAHARDRGTPWAPVVVAGALLVQLGGWWWVFARLWDTGSQGWGAARSAAAAALGTSTAAQVVVALAIVVLSVLVVWTVARVAALERPVLQVAPVDGATPADETVSPRAAD